VFATSYKVNLSGKVRGFPKTNPRKKWQSEKIAAIRTPIWIKAQGLRSIAGSTKKKNSLQSSLKKKGKRTTTSPQKQSDSS